jgi:hypothetical protein
MGRYAKQPEASPIEISSSFLSERSEDREALADALEPAEGCVCCRGNSGGFALRVDFTRCCTSEMFRQTRGSFKFYKSSRSAIFEPREFPRTGSASPSGHSKACTERAREKGDHVAIFLRSAVSSDRKTALLFSIQRGQVRATRAR